MTKNAVCEGTYSFVDFKASAVCFTNPLKTGRYVGIMTTKNQILQLCEVEVYSRGKQVITSLCVYLTLALCVLLFLPPLIYRCICIFCQFVKVLVSTCHFKKYCFGIKPFITSNSDTIWYSLKKKKES